LLSWHTYFALSSLLLRIFSLNNSVLFFMLFYSLAPPGSLFIFHIIMIISFNMNSYRFNFSSFSLIKSFIKKILYIIHVNF
jgi:hypothetical protein